MRSLARLAAVTTGALTLTACWAIGYGPAVDRSQFISARRNDAGIILYTAQDLVYRPATGMRAFPDGGIPRYLTDRNVIGRIDPVTGHAEVVHARKNTEWQSGHGQLNIHDFVGDIAIITESGQRRSDYLTDIHYYLLELSNRSLTPIPLKQDFEARGREVGDFYLLDAHGTLLFVNFPLSARKVETPTNQIWLRRASGEYLMLASRADYYGQSAGELIYWHLESSTLRAYDLAAGTTRLLARNSPMPSTRPDVGVDITSGGRTLELSKRYGDTWRREQVLLTVDKAK